MSTKFHHLRVPGNLTVFASFTGQSDQVLNQIPGLLSFEIALRKARELQKTLLSLAACLLALTLTPPPLSGVAPSGSDRFHVSGHLCPSIDMFSPNLTPTMEKDRGGGVEALVIWAGESHGGKERMERFIHDGDQISSSGSPPTRIGIGVLTSMWLQMYFPEGAEGEWLWYASEAVALTRRQRSEFVAEDALLVCGGANRTIGLPLGEMYNEAVMVLHDPEDTGSLATEDSGCPALGVLIKLGPHGFGPQWGPFFGLGCSTSRGQLGLLPGSSLQQKGVRLCCVSLSLLLLLVKRFSPKDKGKGKL